MTLALHLICTTDSLVMVPQNTDSKFQALQNLTAHQVASIVERTGLSREEVAQQVGCGNSQLFKYEKEGLPPRMNRKVRAAILQLGVETEVLSSNAAIRAIISKLGKG